MLDAFTPFGKHPVAGEWTASDGRFTCMPPAACDTAEAFAAGCPLVVKSRSAKLATCEFKAAAVASHDMPKGTVSLLKGGNHELGYVLVPYPLIKTVSVTASLRRGRALCDERAQRAEPTPIFGEPGSVSQMFILPDGRISSDRAASPLN